MNYTIEFNVTKYIGSANFGLPISADDFTDLMDEATRTGQQLAWEVSGDGITFYTGETEIGCMYFNEIEKEEI